MKLASLLKPKLAPAPRKKILLLGCGSKRDRRVSVPGEDLDNTEAWNGDLVTLDMNPDHKPDVLWDLEKRPLPFEDNTFDRIDAYEILEHLGTQGDWRGFFEEFCEYHRILKPGGLFIATMPSHKSSWAWGDPSHRRVFTVGTTVFLSREQYEKQVGVTPMSDFRFVMGTMDFDRVAATEDDEHFIFVLRAKKT